MDWFFFLPFDLTLTALLRNSWYEKKVPHVIFSAITTQHQTHRDLEDICMSQLILSFHLFMNATLFSEDTKNYVIMFFSGVYSAG